MNPEEGQQSIGLLFLLASLLKIACLSIRKGLKIN